MCALKKNNRPGTRLKVRKLGLGGTASGLSRIRQGLALLGSGRHPRNFPRAREKGFRGAVLAGLPTSHPLRTLPDVLPGVSLVELTGAGFPQNPASLPASLAGLANKIGVDEQKQDKSKPLLDSARGGGTKAKHASKRTWAVASLMTCTTAAVVVPPAGERLPAPPARLLRPRFPPRLPLRLGRRLVMDSAGQGSCGPGASAAYGPDRPTLHPSPGGVSDSRCSPAPPSLRPLSAPGRPTAMLSRPRGSRRVYPTPSLDRREDGSPDAFPGPQSFWCPHPRQLSS